MGGYRTAILIKLFSLKSFLLYSIQNYIIINHLPSPDTELAN